MSKRFLYRYKIVRLYEEDIWGIFFRKQKKRDLFFKKIGYQLFLEIFRKNSYLVNSTVLAWKKKLLYLGRQHTKKNFICQYQLALNLKKRSKFFLFTTQTIYFKNSLKHFNYLVKDSFMVNRKYFFNENRKCFAISFLLLATFPKKISLRTLSWFVWAVNRPLVSILLKAIFNDVEIFNRYVSQLVSTNFKFPYNFRYTFTNIMKWYNNFYYILYIKNLNNIQSSWGTLPTLNNNVDHPNTVSLYLKDLRLNLYFKVFMTKAQIYEWRYRKNSQISQIYQPFFFINTILANRYLNSMWVPLWLYWRILQKKKKRKARYLRNKKFLKSFKHHNYKYKYSKKFQPRRYQQSYSKQSFTRKNNNNKQTYHNNKQAYNNNKQFNKQSNKYSFKKSYKQHKRKASVIKTIRIKRIRPKIKYFSLLSWYKWRVKNKQLLLHLQIKFAKFLQKCNEQKRFAQMLYANAATVRCKQHPFKFFEPSKVLQEPKKRYARKKKKNLFVSKKVKKSNKKNTVAKIKKNSKMTSLTHNSSSISNKNTMLITQKRFYTTETNISFFKQNQSKIQTNFDQKRILKSKHNNEHVKEKNFSLSDKFRKTSKGQGHNKERIFIIKDANQSNPNKKIFVFKRKKNQQGPRGKFKQITRKRKSYKPLLITKKKLLEPKVLKLDALVCNYKMNVSKSGGFFGGYILPNKQKRKILNKKAGSKLFFWKAMQKLSSHFFLSSLKKRAKYLSRFRGEKYSGLKKIYYNWSIIKFFARKKYHVCSVKKKFRPKRYSSLSWHFCLLFQKNKNNKIFSTFRYYWKTHKFFNFLKKFSFKSKIKFLLYYVFRYASACIVCKINKLTFRSIFFLQKLSNKYYLLNKSTLLSWSSLLEKKISYNFNYNIFLNLYITYIMSKQFHAKYYSFLPFVRNILTCYNTLLYANTYNIIKDNKNNFEPVKSSFTLFNFINSSVLNRYKIYFYLFYTFWYLFNGNIVYFKYLKYLELCQDFKQLNISYSNIKNLYINKIFLHFSHTFLKNNNINIFTFFNLNTLKFVDCVFFFNSWFLNYLVMFYDNIISVRKFKFYANIKKSKHKLLANTKNEYVLLKKLLELFCLKKKSEALSKYNLFFKKWIHTVAYAQKKIRRLLYSVRIFFYHKYNKVPESDSIFNVTAEDLINAVKKKNPLSSANVKNNRKDNFPLKDFMKLFLKNKGLKQRKKLELKEFYCNDNIQFKKTEYLLSFFASNQMFKYFNKLRRKYLSFFAKKRQLFLRKINKNITLVSEYNPIFKFSLLKKYSIFLFRKILQIKKRIKFFSLRKRKTLLDKMFTLDLIPVVKYVKKRTSFNSFYKYRMLKIWKFRKFYGCLTNYELNSICLKAYKYRGDIILRFIILLEGRLDTVLYRCGLVTSMFEARQLINHGNFLINNVLVKKRSYVLQVKDILSIEPSKITLFKKKLLLRLQQDGLLFWPPVYLEVNYKYILVMFIHELLQINQIPFNFKLTGKDLNSILYYYY